MKIHFLLILSVFALFVGGCASDSLRADEDYEEPHSGFPAAGPDPTSHIPGPPSSNPLYNRTGRY